MPFLAVTLVLSLLGIAMAALIPGLSDWLLLAAPTALACLWLLIKRRKPSRDWIVLDGSNIMFWNDNSPSLQTVRDVVLRLQKMGLRPIVVFDANVGYKVSGQYFNEAALADQLGLPKGLITVAPKGMPADPLVLQAARQRCGRVVSNDRFRDWADDYADVLHPQNTVRGGYKRGKLWFSDQSMSLKSGNRL